MKEKRSLFIIFLLFPIFVLSQTLNIYKNDGTVYNISVSDIDSITYPSVKSFNCGEIIVYGNKSYETVLIGSQCWFKKNLNIGSRIDSELPQKGNGKIEKYCYKDLDTNCAIYGGLYQWDEAMDYLLKLGRQGICPNGWHIPKLGEFRILKAAVTDNGNAVKEIGQGIAEGAGTNISGFSALLSGERDKDRAYGELGKRNFTWSSTDSNKTIASRMSLHYDNNKFGTGDNNKEKGFSVRCLKD